MPLGLPYGAPPLCLLDRPSMKGMHRLKTDATAPMSELFADRLTDAIRAKAAPICVGIDPMLDQLPDDVFDDGERDEQDVEAAIDAIFEFTTRVLQVVAPLVPVVKFQSAYFEKYLWEG